MSLDKLDLQIIEQLRADARMPVRAIARALGVSNETVRYRLNRLTSEKILRIVCVTNPERLGYQFRLLIGARARPGCTESVAKQLADLPGIIDVSLTGSHFNILVWALLRDRNDFERFVSESLTSVCDMMSIEIMHSFHTLKEFWLGQRLGKEGMDDFPEEPLSELDQSVIKAMQASPRQTITELAGTIGRSKPVTRTTLEKLMREGTIGFVPVVSMTMLEYDTWVVLLIKAEPDKVNAVAHELSKQDATWHVSLITGQWQVYAVATFEDSQQIHDFMTETMNGIPGITAFEVIPQGRHVKFTFPPGSESGSELN